MTKEALKLALEALEMFCEHGAILRPIETRGAIKEALAQPEQEPVAYLCENAVGHKYFRWKKPSSTYKPIALYTTPLQRKPLTDEQISAASKGHMTRNGFARAIEAAHNIKEQK